MATSVILTFHGIQAGPIQPGPGLDPATATYTIRREQLDCALSEATRYACCTTREMLSKRNGDWRILTFDDGFATDFEVVYPLLLSRGLRGTFFVTANHVGRDGYVTAPQLREMAAAGMEIGSHGLTHRYLPGMPRCEVVREIQESKIKIEQMIGADVTGYAPVGGHFRRWMVDAAVRAGYRVFATMIPGRATNGREFLLLRRNYVRPHHNARDIASLVRGQQGVLLRSRLRYSLLKLPKDILGLPKYDLLKNLLFGTLLRKRFQPTAFRDR
jgi:peptidoglycan/xylan/chitin deacetylase (PgdA/CDA1 family)